MKVMHLMSTHAFSGAENVACQIINLFKDDKGTDMIYVSEIKENKEILDNKSIKYYKLDSFNYRNIKKAVLETKPDIIHAHDIKASIMASLFYKNAIIISHIHCNHENMRKFTLKSFLYMLFSKRFRKMIWVSQSALDSYYYNNKIIDKSIVLYNVVNKQELTDSIKKDKNDYIVDVCYVGRLSFQKDPLRIIDVISLVKMKIDNIKVGIVGNGELESNLKHAIQDKGLQDNIILYGFRENPYKILDCSKLMLMTSRYEGTPMCALEAIALGKPIVSTPTDGLKSIIKNNITGYLSDDNQALADKIIELLRDKNKYEHMCKNVIKLDKEINDLEKYKYKLENIYTGGLDES